MVEQPQGKPGRDLHPRQAELHVEREIAKDTVELGLVGDVSESHVDHVVPEIDDAVEQRWRDRTEEGPYDTHTLRIHPDDPRRLCSAAGDGYFESRDGGASWQQPQVGLDVQYLWGCAIDAIADVVLVSAASGPREAHSIARAESRIYRKSGDATWDAVADGLPPAAGTTVASLAVDPAAPAHLYAANNHGVFRSTNAGRAWRKLEIDWPEPFQRQRVAGLVVVPGEGGKDGASWIVARVN